MYFTSFLFYLSSFFVPVGGIEPTFYLPCLGYYPNKGTGNKTPFADYYFAGGKGYLARLQSAVYQG